MKKVLVIAQIDHNEIAPATAATIAAAQKLGASVDLLLASDNAALSEQAALMAGIAQVRFAQDPRFQHPIAEDLSALIAAIASEYSHVFAPATTFGKNLLPRAAALCDVCCLSDVTQITDPNVFVRPIYAGNAFETVRCQSQPIMATIRPTAFQPVDHQETSVPIEPLAVTQPAFEKTRYIRLESPENERPDLGIAKIVVSGGRAFKSAENFKKLEALADQLGAAIGATRAAVDAGFAPNDLQVGQTGKVVAPDLYMAFGISGAIQHIAGIKDSKIIVAINQDPEAPIFEVADYGLVGDIFTVLPALSSAIGSKRS